MNIQKRRGYGLTGRRLACNQEIGVRFPVAPLPFVVAGSTTGYESLAVRDVQIMPLVAGVTRMAMGSLCKGDYAGSNPVTSFLKSEYWIEKPDQNQGSTRMLP